MHGLTIMFSIVSQVHTRFIVNQGTFQVRIIDKDGIHELPNLTPKMIENVRPPPQ